MRFMQAAEWSYLRMLGLMMVDSTLSLLQVCHAPVSFENCRAFTAVAM
jgi:hypothetical protein